MRFLFVSSFPPLPNNNGSRQRTKLILDALSQVGHVDLCLHADWPMPADYVEQVSTNYRLQAYQISPDPIGTPFMPLMAFSHRLAYKLAHLYTPRKLYYRAREKFVAAVDQLTSAHRYDLVVGRYFRSASRSGLFAQPAVALDVDDVDWEYFESQSHAAGTSPFHRRLFARYARDLRRMMNDRLRQTEIAWVTKSEDLGRVQAKRTRLLPNVVDTDAPMARAPSNSATPTLLFVDTLAWHPHRQGLLRFIDRILPKVAAAHPNVQLRVISSECPEDFGQQLRGRRHVEFLGRVDDIGQYYRSSLFSVVPMYFGAGSHIKIPESLYFGAPCVVTPFGHRGYEATLPAGECLLRADTDEEFAEACIRLISDVNLRSSLAQAGLARVSREYTRGSFYRRVADAIEEVKSVALAVS